MSSRGANTGRASSIHSDEEAEGGIRASAILAEASFDGVSSKRKLPPSPDSYPVVFTVTLVLGFPVNKDSKHKLKPAIKLRKPNEKPTLTGKSGRHGISAAAGADKSRGIEGVDPAQVKINSHYHVEYQLIPGEDPIKTDIMIQNVNIARIYPERNDPKTIKTWVSMNNVWISWTHSHTVNLNMDRLLTLFKHKIDVRIWDLREMCASKARFDRPRSVGRARIEVIPPTLLGDVHDYVVHHSGSFLRTLPRVPYLSRPLPITDHGSEFAEGGAAIVEEPTQDTLGPWTSASPERTMTIYERTASEMREEGATSGIGALTGRQASGVATGLNASSSGLHSASVGGAGGSALAEGPPQVHVTAAASESGPPTTLTTSGDGSDFGTGATSGLGPLSAGPPLPSPSQMSKRKSIFSRLEGAIPGETEQVKKNGRCTISMEANMLFTGTKEHTVRLNRSVTNIADAFFTVSLDRELLDAYVLPRLNPLTIRVLSLTSLPDKPVSLEDLKEKCQPVYCKYRFLGQTHSRRTAGRTPAGKLYWNDTYVVLAGTLDGVALREYLAGGAGHGAGANGASGFGGFVVEVHDRDRKPPKHVEKPPALFGTDPEDEALNTVNYIAAKRIIYEAGHSRNASADPSDVKAQEPSSRNATNLTTMSRLTGAPSAALGNAQSQNSQQAGAGGSSPRDSGAGPAGAAPPSETGDPFGVARFDLSPILDGVLALTCSVLVQPSPPSDPLAKPQNATSSGPITTAIIFGDESSPMQPADYLKAETTLKVKFTLAHPLPPLPSVHVYDSQQGTVVEQQQEGSGRSDEQITGSVSLSAAAPAVEASATAGTVETSTGSGTMSTAGQAPPAAPVVAVGDTSSGTASAAAVAAAVAIAVAPVTPPLPIKLSEPESPISRVVYLIRVDPAYRRSLLAATLGARRGSGLSSNVPSDSSGGDAVSSASWGVWAGAESEQQYRIERFVRDSNARALGLTATYQLENLVSSALDAYKLTPAQKQSRSVDIITGFVLSDGDCTLLILEGLRSRALAQMLQELNSRTLPSSNVETAKLIDLRVLYDTSVPYTTRLYADFDAVPRRLRLRAPIHLLCQQPLLYVRNMVPLACFQALSKLQEIIGASDYHTLVHNNLFPLAEQVDALHQEFGISYEKAGLALLSKAPTQAKTTATSGGASDSPHMRLLRSIEAQRRRASGSGGGWNEERTSDRGITDDTAAAGSPRGGGAVQRSGRKAAPLEHTNLDFMRLLEERAEREAEAPPDFLHENRLAVKLRSEQLAQNRPLPPVAYTHPPSDAESDAFIYGGQALNTVELAKQDIRSVLQRRRLYTYSPDYWSLTFEPEDSVVQQRNMELRDLDKSKRVGTRDWVYPGVPSSVQCNRHARAPDAARVVELRDERWVENVLHGARMRPTVEGRSPFPWNARTDDIELYKRPRSTFGQEPISMDSLPEFSQFNRRITRVMRDYTDAAHTGIPVHRLLAASELVEQQGFAGSNQIDRLKGLLKDAPQKLAFRMNTVDAIPPLACVAVGNDELVGANGTTDEKRRMKFGRVGYTPGDNLERSLTVEDNHIPRRDYEHRAITRLRGSEFAQYVSPREFREKRPHRSTSESAAGTRATAPEHPAGVPIRGLNLEQAFVQGVGPKYGERSVHTRLPLKPLPPISS